MKILSILLFLATAQSLSAQTLPPVPVPVENPITESKRVLGKMLFWDEQMSSDNTMACGTCHMASSAGADSRFGLNPGIDGIFGNEDDVNGSPGVIDSQADGTFVMNDTFSLLEQITGRAANNYGMIQYAPELFWDGRAGGEFIDPETGEILIAEGGALESQAVGPPMADAEMAHRNRDWPSLTNKLITVRPMALATNVPEDMALAVAVHGTYPELFTAAFGDENITASRIAMAIATYERTLVADDTPYDRTQNGESGGLTTSQQQGLDMFDGPMMLCGECHTPPMFTDFTFRNNGLRPIEEDAGRFNVTKNTTDLGKFKVPSLRNVGLQSKFMHNGRLLTLDDVFDFYAGLTEQFPDNQDPLIAQIFLPDMARDSMIDFLENGLLDNRLANETFPFDRPTLNSELTPNPFSIHGGTAGSGDITPTMIAVDTPNLGNADFRFGISDALGSSEAHVEIYRTEEDALATANAISTLGPITLEGKGAGTGYGTIHWPIPSDPTLLSATVYAKWIVSDAIGDAYSDLVEVAFYASDPTSCNCPGDVTCDSIVGVNDILAIIEAWGDCNICGSDLNQDGAVDVIDLLSIIDNWGGC